MTVIHRMLDLQRAPAPVCVASIDEIVAELSSGELIEVLASGPLAVMESSATSRAAGIDLLESSRLGNVYRFVLRKR